LLAILQRKAAAAPAGVGPTHPRPLTPEEERLLHTAQDPRGPNFFDNDIKSIDFDFWGDLFHVNLRNGRTITIARSQTHGERAPGGGRIRAIVLDPAIDRTVPIACTPADLPACSQAPEKHLWIERTLCPRFMAHVDHVDNVLVPQALKGQGKIFRTLKTVVTLALVRVSLAGAGGGGGPKPPLAPGAAAGGEVAVTFLEGGAATGARTILVDTASGRVVVGVAGQWYHAEVFEAAGLTSEIGVVGGYGTFQSGSLVSFELTSGFFPGTLAERNIALAILKGLLGQ
jgi:hypothetical protein